MFGKPGLKEKAIGFHICTYHIIRNCMEPVLLGQVTAAGVESDVPLRRAARGTRYSAALEYAASSLVSRELADLFRALGRDHSHGR